MPRFAIAGRNANIQGQIGTKINEHAEPSGGYTAGQQKQLEGLAKTLQAFCKELPADANVSISGDITYSGTTLSATIQINANHPQLVTEGETKEPTSTDQPTGAGENMFASLSAPKVGETGEVNTTRSPSSPTISRNPVADPAVPLGGNR